MTHRFLCGIARPDAARPQVPAAYGVVLVEGEEHQPLPVLRLRLLDGSDRVVLMPPDVLRAGSRPVLAAEGLPAIEALLRRHPAALDGFLLMPWNRRYRALIEGMSGDTRDLVEAVMRCRRLAMARHPSFGERQVAAVAQAALATEIGLARGTDRDEATRWIDLLLTGSDWPG